MELAQLVRDSQTGDQAAQERLILAVQDRLYFSCRMMTSDREEALDATQDVLVKMLEGLGSLREPEAFWGWLRQIAVRVCLRRMKRVRGEWRRQKPLEEWDEPETPDIVEDAERLAEQAEVRQAIRKLVDSLPPQQRTCILLYYYEEMPVEEIAALLKVPTGTVKSRLHCARRTIRKGAEESERRGFPLRGLTPLPLIRIVLLQEAAGTDFTVLAGTAGAAAGGAAIGAALRSLGAALHGKRAALAVLAAAAAIAAGALLPHPAAVVPAQTDQAARYVQSEPSGVPETPEIQEPPVPETLSETPPQPESRPAQQKPPAVQTGAKLIPPVQPEPEEPKEIPEPEPVPETPPPSWEPGFDLPVGPLQPVVPLDPTLEEPDPPAPVDPIPEEPDPPAPVDPTPEEPDPPVPVDPTPEEPDSPAPVDPTPEEPDPPVPVDPTPEEPDPPAPVDPTPEEPDVYVTERSYAESLGINGYGNTDRFAQAWGSSLPQVEMTYSSSNPEVAVINEEGVFTTLSAGTAVLSAVQTVQEDLLMRYDLTVEVEDRFNWLMELPGRTLQEKEVQFCGLEGWQWQKLEGYEIKLEKIQWTSSNPPVAEIQDQNGWSCNLRAAMPGTAQVTGAFTFRLDTAVGEMTTEDECTFEVTVVPAPEVPPEEPDPPENLIPPEEPDSPENPETPPQEEALRKELTAFGYHSGYGYQSAFGTEWGEALPEGLAYSSSDENVVKISRETGKFYTVSAGEAELTAADPEGCVSGVLLVKVQDRFEWQYEPVEELTLDVGQSARHGVTAYIVPQNTWTVFGIWTVSDQTIAALEDSTYWQDHLITGVHSGAATVTCTVTFELKTFEGYVRMKDVFTFPVRVAFSELGEAGGANHGLTETPGRCLQRIVYDHIE